MNDTKKQTIVENLCLAYSMEMESVQNYLAHAINLDGLAAEELKENLMTEVDEELSHAKVLAERIRVLCGTVPGSKSLEASQDYLQPAKDSTDLRFVIEGVVKAEEQAISTYKHIIELCEKCDPVTQDICIQILKDEEEHRRKFQGFLKKLSC